MPEHSPLSVKGERGGDLTGVPVPSIGAAQLRGAIRRRRFGVDSNSVEIDTPAKVAADECPKVCILF